MRLHLDYIGSRASRDNSRERQTATRDPDADGRGTGSTMHRKLSHEDLQSGLCNAVEDYLREAGGLRAKN